jgi:DNA-binding GntR family transcriptional regulator
VWLALYRPLVEETVPKASPATVEAMRADNAAYLAALAAEDNQQLARANFDFFSRLQAESQNAALRRALTSVVHLVRLGSLYLPERIDLATLSEAQAALIGAAADHDVAGARRAMDLLGGIRVPVE